MSSAQALAPVHGVAPACAALGVPVASFYRTAFVGPPRPDARRSPRKLSDAENQRVLETLNSERFMDRSPPQIHATLLDEGRYPAG